MPHDYTSGLTKPKDRTRGMARSAAKMIRGRSRGELAAMKCPLCEHCYRVRENHLIDRGRRERANAAGPATPVPVLQCARRRQRAADAERLQDGRGSDGLAPSTCDTEIAASHRVKRKYVIGGSRSRRIAIALTRSCAPTATNDGSWPDASRPGRKASSSVGWRAPAARRRASRRARAFRLRSAASRCRDRWASSS
jgi:hypothetical protein